MFLDHFDSLSWLNHLKGKTGDKNLKPGANIRWSIENR